VSFSPPSVLEIGHTAFLDQQVGWMAHSLPDRLHMNPRRTIKKSEAQGPMLHLPNDMISQVMRGDIDQSQ